MSQEKIRMQVARERNDIPKDAMVLTPSELVTLLDRRQHPVYIASYDLQEFLRACSMTAIFLRHLWECPENCRSHLTDRAINILVAKAVALTAGGIKEDSPAVPEDMWSGEGVPIVPTPSIEGLPQVYGKVAGKQLGRLISQIVATHILAHGIETCPNDDLARDIAVEAAQFVETFWDWGFVVLETALAKAKIDVTEFSLMHLSVRLMLETARESAEDRRTSSKPEQPQGDPINQMVSDFLNHGGRHRKQDIN